MAANRQTCTTHPHVRLICPACVAEQGAGVTSEAKARAARENGKKGGRPRRDGKPSQPRAGRVKGRPSAK